MNEAELLTAPEVAVILRIPISSVYFYAGNGLLPSIKFGRQRRFKKSEIETWLNEQSGQIKT